MRLIRHDLKVTFNFPLKNSAECTENRATSRSVVVMSAVYRIRAMRLVVPVDNIVWHGCTILKALSTSSTYHSGPYLNAMSLFVKWFSIFLVAEVS